MGKGGGWFGWLWIEGKGDTEGSPVSGLQEKGCSLSPAELVGCASRSAGTRGSALDVWCLRYKVGCAHGDGSHGAGVLGWAAFCPGA